LIRKFYDPVLISALNENTRDVSAHYAIQVFRESLLANAAGYRIGLPSCPLGELYSKLPCRDVRLATRVADILFNGTRISGVNLASGETLTADTYIIAVNHHNLRRWIPDHIAKSDSRFERLHELLDVPILGVHLWFDRPVMRESHAALVDGPLQWLFRKDATGQSVHGVISAARDWLARDRDESLRLFEHQVRQTLPLAQKARLLRGVIVIEKRATFSPAPGSDDARPPQSPPPGGIANLYLAGDYTKTDWPATMEGAVRSGYLAAEAITRQRFLVPDLPQQWPMRILGS
jgi:zeta-carotene desaturase